MAGGSVFCADDKREGKIITRAEEFYRYKNMSLSRQLRTHRSKNDLFQADTEIRKAYDLEQ
ncbi:hypothetical protein NLN86_12515 [Citrobacter portucalensis]|uniref:Uncharacterized protein n=1 Tax=Citrobacter portucalensis TaxID=1639133 RepID=A0AAW5W5Q8_9ENTR|nr:hypothetical protein [Citrobacter portucalensis]MCX9002471.1 hypothetical protein [Citrobacter portucalensis]